MDRTKHLDNTQPLYEAVMALDSITECEEFFQDICTPAELSALAQRMQIARMLMEGATYVEIRAKTGASTMLISRTQNMVRNGNNAAVRIIERCMQSRPEDK